jgi:lipoic acid synthetase
LDEFKELREYGRAIGFKWVEAAPLVRSSYHAAEQVQALSIVHHKLYGETGTAHQIIREQQSNLYSIDGGTP